VAAMLLEIRHRYLSQYAIMNCVSIFELICVRVILVSFLLSGIAIHGLIHWMLITFSKTC